MKRAQSTLAMPAAITALSGNDLKAAGVNTVDDVQNIAPSVTISRNGFGVNTSIRGVTTTDTTSKGEQGVAFNIDGVSYGRPIQQGLAFFDVNRVEALRGPQGTLYGKSSTGGVINMSVGLFGQLTWHPTSRLDLVLGLRQSKDELQRFGMTAIGLIAGCTYPDTCAGSPNNGKEEASKLTYRVGANYHLNTTDMIYGSVSTGYKAGGFNDFDPATHGISAYDPEELTAYELGWAVRSPTRPIQPRCSTMIMLVTRYPAGSSFRERLYSIPAWCRHDLRLGA